jgi:hypothetical protein
MKEVKLSTTTSITTTYAGEATAKYISAALLSSTTIDNGGISVLPNIKYKQIIRNFSTDGLVKDATCDFSDTSTITTVERVIEPESFQVNLELCKQTFRSDWDAISMGFSAFDKIPKNFQDYLIGYVAAKVAAKNESNIWHGVNATTGEYDGLVVLATADGTVVDVAGTTITSGNVVVEMRKVTAVIPTNLWGDPELKLYVARSVAQAYVESLGGFVATIGGAGTDNKGAQWYNGTAGLMIDGIPLFVASGLEDDYMMLAKKDNLWFGTGLLNDMSVVKVLDMADLDGSENVRVILRYTDDVQYGIGSEIVLYTP